MVAPANGTLPPLYLFGVPGRVGGAATKIAHLIRLLHRDFHITVVLPQIACCKDKQIKQLTEPYGVPCRLLKDLPKPLSGVGLAICELHFFTSGTAREAKARGLKIFFARRRAFNGSRF